MANITADPLTMDPSHVATARTVEGRSPTAHEILEAEERRTGGQGPLDGVLRFIGLVVALYAFLLGIALIGSSFKLLAGSSAGGLFQSVSHPVVALMVGMVATAALQSSSTTTSILVGLVAGGALDLSAAIPMVMGANIGTSVTNTLVSLGHANNRDEFRRAFAGATIHDFFNLLSVAVLLPIELLFHPIERLSGLLAGALLGGGGGKFESPIDAVLKPVEKAIISVDKGAIEAAARGEVVDGSLLSGGIFHGAGLSDVAVGTTVLVGGAVLTVVALLGIVRIMKGLLQARAATLLERALGANAWVSMALGAGATVAVQSSSITTSTLVPLVGVGIVSLEAVFPLTLGANVGTTITALIASMANSGPGAILGLQIALCHLLFNVLGILVWYPIPAMRRIPLAMARGLGEAVARNRLYAPAYVAMVFFVLPLAIIGLERAFG